MRIQKVKIINQYCKLLFSLKVRMKQEWFVLVEGAGEEVYKILSVKRSPKVIIGGRNLSVFIISIIFPITGLTNIKVPNDHQEERSYILEA